jgi:hypothetical protein
MLTQNASIELENISSSSRVDGRAEILPEVIILLIPNLNSLRAVSQAISLAVLAC